MKRSVKIASAIAVVAVCVLAVIGYLIVFAIWLVFRRGLNWQTGLRRELPGRYDEAMKKFTAALKKPLPGDQRLYVYLNRGTAHNFKWEFDAAIGDFTEALRLNPALADAYGGRGYAWQWKGKTDKAIADLTEAIRLDPNSNQPITAAG